VSRQLFEVARVVAQRKDSAVHGRMQRLDPSAEHLGEAGDLLHAADVDARISQQPLSATGREQLKAKRFESTSEIDDPCFVVDRENGAHGKLLVRLYHACSAALDAHATLGEGAHRARQQAVLAFTNARVQRGHVVVVTDLEALL